MSTAPSARPIVLVVGTSLLSAAAIAAAVTAIHWTRYGARRRRRRRRRQWWTHKSHDDDDDIAYPDKAQILELRRRYFSKSNSVSYENTGPLMIVKSEGSRLIDENGVSYLDTRNNVAHCGHCHPRIVQAVQQQVATLNTNTRYLHPTICELAQRLVQSLQMPSHSKDVDSDENKVVLDTVFFCNSGSEANDLALRLARAWSGGTGSTTKTNTIVVDRAYHGHTLATLDVSPYKYETSLEYSNAVLLENHHSATMTTHASRDASASPDVHDSDRSVSCSPSAATPGRHIWKVPCPDTWRGPYRNSATAGALYAAHVQEACRYYIETCHERVGAFIVEGGLSVAGVVLPPSGYIRASVEAVRAAGGLYIADEVQTGFGRLGSCFWAFAYQHDQNEKSETGDIVVPDIVTVGKPFGNGMPLAAVVTTRAVANAFEACHVEYFNTFGGNPVSAAAGLAVLNVIRDEGLQENALKVGTYIMDQLRRLQDKIECIGDVRGSGLFIGVEFVDCRDTKAPATALTSWLCSQLKVVYRILTSIDGPYANVLVIKPPMVFSLDDANYFVQCVDRALSNDLPALQKDSLIGMSQTPT